jgi:preprotein translocase subunit SecD
MTAGVLFWFGSGTVKGFALTLAIGVFVSFFTAVIVTQMLLQWAIEFPALRKRRLYGVEERPADTRGTPTAVPATLSR